MMESGARQIGDHVKIRSAGNDGGCEWDPCALSTQQIIERIKIRSVTDGGAWGWGPTRTKQ